MARHRRIITRGSLLDRYATVSGLTFGEAHDLHKDTDIQVLRDLVDSLESHRGVPFPQRRRFAKSQPTTSLHGQTR